MGDCNVIECEGDDKIPYTCNECGGTFCSSHRLPESHNCSGLKKPDAGDGAILSTGLQGKKKVKPGTSPGSGSLQTGSNSSGRGWLLLLIGLVVGGMIIASLFVGSGSNPLSGNSQPAVTTTESAVIESTTNSGGVTEHSATTTLEGSTAQLSADRIEELVHQKINEERSAEGLQELTYDPELEEIALYHSEDMAERDYFAHTSPDGEEMADRYDMFNFNCRVNTGGNQYATGGENIFRQSYTGMSFTAEELATQTVDGWMGSPGHRENILRDYWEKEGIGVYITQEDGETEMYVTQNFC